ncbi:MAG: prephenate dehydrogenase/arogenate dehydrogenase family protein [Chloroherpetonaceae bacterium]|nr:prephenate dehydrogenase/arogenate dehydrogenase family protein [Chthonomonadaceae bacterium]MDW8206763.1 prephenate dehydrogenase/arogenate dehydrogenase family protein [Chloroherpetonaceae bacterium]
MTRFTQVTIVGVGLMGGSLGMALRARGLATTVIGVDQNPDTLQRALAIGAVDQIATSLRAGVRQADLVVFATPVGVLPALLQQAAPDIPAHALVTDLGSVKHRIVEAGSHCFGNRFVGGHPMTGSEQNGVDAARADLFQGAPWALVRRNAFVLEEDPEAACLAALLRALGATPVPLQARQHDRLVALVSHLPHALSFTFARTVNEHPEADVARMLAAGSYRDLTRIAQSDPALWRDIFLDNREALLAALQAFSDYLDALRARIEDCNPDELWKTLQRARHPARRET